MVNDRTQIVGEVAAIFAAQNIISIYTEFQSPLFPGFTAELPNLTELFQSELFRTFFIDSIVFSFAWIGVGIARNYYKPQFFSSAGSIIDQTNDQFISTSNIVLLALLGNLLEHNTHIDLENIFSRMILSYTFVLTFRQLYLNKT